MDARTKLRIMGYMGLGLAVGAICGQAMSVKKKTKAQKAIEQDMFVPTCETSYGPHVFDFDDKATGDNDPRPLPGFHLFSVVDRFRSGTNVFLFSITDDELVRLHNETVLRLEKRLQDDPGVARGLIGFKNLRVK